MLSARGTATSKKGTGDNHKPLAQRDHHGQVLVRAFMDTLIANDIGQSPAKGQLLVRCHRQMYRQVAECRVDISLAGDGDVEVTEDPVSDVASVGIDFGA